MKDNRKEVIDKLKDKDKIEKEFSDLIRLGMNDKQLWAYIQSWKDVESIIEDMESWDIEAKEFAIKEIEEHYL